MYRPCLLLLPTILLLCSFCAGDDETTDGGGDGSEDQCPNISGAWTIVEHCEAEVVGTAVTTTQDGCQVLTWDPWDGWSGTVTVDGEVTTSGPGAGGEEMTCTGTASEDGIELSCQPTCEVALQR